MNVVTFAMSSVISVNSKLKPQCLLCVFLPLSKMYSIKKKLSFYFIISSIQGEE